MAPKKKKSKLEEPWYAYPEQIGNLQYTLKIPLHTPNYS